MLHKAFENSSSSFAKDEFSLNDDNDLQMESNVKHDNALWKIHEERLVNIFSRIVSIEKKLQEQSACVLQNSSKKKKGGRLGDDLAMIPYTENSITSIRDAVSQLLNYAVLESFERTLSNKNSLICTKIPDISDRNVIVQNNELEQHEKERNSLLTLSKAALHIKQKTHCNSDSPDWMSSKLCIVLHCYKNFLNEVAVMQKEIHELQSKTNLWKSFVIKNGQNVSLPNLSKGIKNDVTQCSNNTVSSNQSYVLSLEKPAPSQQMFSSVVPYCLNPVSMSMYPHHRQATSNFALRRGYIVSPNTSIVASKSASHYRNVLDINHLSSQQVDTTTHIMTKPENHYQQLRPINNDGFIPNYSLPLSPLAIGSELIKPQVQYFGQPNDNYKAFSTNLSQSENLSRLQGTRNEFELQDTRIDRSSREPSFAGEHSSQSQHETAGSYEVPRQLEFGKQPMQLDRGNFSKIFTPISDYLQMNSHSSQPYSSTSQDELVSIHKKQHPNPKTSSPYEQTQSNFRRVSPQDYPTQSFLQSSHQASNNERDNLQLPVQKLQKIKQQQQQQQETQGFCHAHNVFPTSSSEAYISKLPNQSNYKNENSASQQVSQDIKKDHQRYSSQDLQNHQRQPTYKPQRLVQPCQHQRTMLYHSPENNNHEHKINHQQSFFVNEKKQSNREQLPNVLHSHQQVLDRQNTIQSQQFTLNEPESTNCCLFQDAEKELYTRQHGMEQKSSNMQLNNVHKMIQGDSHSMKQLRQQKIQIPDTCLDQKSFICEPVYSSPYSSLYCGPVAYQQPMIQLDQYQHLVGNQRDYTIPEVEQPPSQTINQTTRFRSLQTHQMQSHYQQLQQNHPHNHSMQPVPLQPTQLQELQLQAREQQTQLQQAQLQQTQLQQAQLQQTQLQQAQLQQAQLQQAQLQQAQLQQAQLQQAQLQQGQLKQKQLQHSQHQQIQLNSGNGHSKRYEQFQQTQNNNLPFQQGQGQ